MLLQFKSRKKVRKRIMMVSLQKSGTHLLMNILQQAGLSAVGVSKDCQLGDFKGLRENEYLWSHFAPGDSVLMALEEKQPIYIIFNYRDPRDVLVSWFHWMHPKSEKSMHSCIAYMKKVYAHFSDAEIMDFFIRNEKFREVEYNPIEHFRWCRVLYFHPRVLKVRFEDLIGANGGGNDKAQIQTIESIFKYLEIDGIDARAVAAKAFDKKSATFRKGQIGQYKEELTAAQLKLFNELHGDIVSQYGYTPDVIG
jgi:hypothetical protein